MMNTHINLELKPCVSIQNKLMERTRRSGIKLLRLTPIMIYTNL